MAVDGWRTATVTELQRDGVLLVQDGNHGEYRPRPDEFASYGVAFIRAADMDDGRVVFDTASKINDRARQRITKGIGRGGDVLLSHKGTVGKVALAPDDAPPFVCSPQTTFWRTLDPKVLDRRYLHSLLRSPLFQQQLRSRAGETDMAPYVSLTSQRGLLVTIPPIEEQHAITSILGALDDKIDLNRRINQTLEAIARALFKSWFVDFDPVRAKMDGRLPFGMDAETAALFPRRFVSSKLGLIPEAWTVSSIGSEMDFAYGSPLKEADRRGGPVPVFGSNGTIGWHDQALAAGPGVVVGRKGNPGTVKWSAVPFFAIDTTFFVVPKSPELSLHYLFLALERLNLARLGADSAVPGLNRNIAYQTPLLLPSSPLQTAYMKVAGPIFERIQSSERESRTLTATRDTLLPKLLSGQLRVIDAEHLAGAAL